MKKHIKLLIAGILLPCLLLALAPAGFAQVPPDLGEISIYTLDNGDLSDSISNASLKTADATVQVNEATSIDKSNLMLVPDQNGEANKAVKFDGTYYIQTQEQATTFPVTFSVWFKADDVSGEHSIVDSDVSGQYGFSLIIGYDDPGDPRDTPKDGSLSVQYHDGVWDSNVIIEKNTWYQAYVTYNADTITLYVGAKDQPLRKISTTYTKGILPSVDDPNPARFRFGRHNPGDPQWFKGDISEVRFYNKALSTDDVEDVTGKNVASSKSILCTAWGDVHFITCDGVKYDYQGVGDFVLMRSTPADVMIQTRQEAWKTNSAVAINTAIAMKLGNDKLEFYLTPSPSLQVNDVQTALPADSTPVTLPSGGSIKLSMETWGTAYLISWPDTLTTAKLVFRPSYMDIYLLTLNSALTYEGMLGNSNADQKDDLRTRDGTLINQPASIRQINQLGESWRVVAGEALLDPVTTQQAIRPSSMQALASMPYDDAKQVCVQAGVSQPIALDACIFDVAATGSPDFVTSALAIQELIQQNPSMIIVPTGNAQEIFLPLVSKQ